jgi:hypothetical protein
MSKRYLGKTIDIHCGGQDLQFPHHENEIAQSEAANGCKFVDYWLHNGFLNIDNKKMSKSENNFFTVRDAAEAYGYAPIRFFMLSAHYRSPLNYSRESLTQAQAALERLYTAADNLDFLAQNGAEGEMTPAETEFTKSFDEYRRGGGYEALLATVGKLTPGEVVRAVMASGLTGRGGAGFPTGRKWSGVPPDAPYPRFVQPNTDEMEPGTFKDRILVNADPHLVLEGIILCAYAVRAERAGRGLSRGAHPGQRLLVRHHRASERRALHLRRSNGPGQRHPGPEAQSGQGPGLAPDRGRALGPAHGGQQRRDPGLGAAHPHPRAGLVQEPGGHAHGRRHQALLRERQGGQARLL